MDHLAEPLPMGNTIRHNHCQGILLEESTSADIFCNNLHGNFKANIALGGESSGETQVKWNQIDHGLREGVFVVEGEETLQIHMNFIQSNDRGLVLLRSDGDVVSNRLIDNNVGLQLVSETVGKIQDNYIERNKEYGVEMLHKAGEHVIFRQNTVKNNGQY